MQHIAVCADDTLDDLLEPQASERATRRRPSTRKSDADWARDTSATERSKYSRCLQSATVLRERAISCRFKAIS